MINKESNKILAMGNFSFCFSKIGMKLRLCLFLIFLLAVNIGYSQKRLCCSFFG
jgi:hypothetical protein